MVFSASAQKGFTLFEILIAVVVLLILSAAAAPAIKPIIEGIQLYTTANGIRSQLVCAKTRAIGDSQLHCGVHFDTGATPQRVQVFMDNGSPENNGSYDDGDDEKFMTAYVLPPTCSLKISGEGISDVIIFRGDGSTKIHGMTLTLFNSKRIKNISVLPSTGSIKITDQ